MMIAAWLVAVQALYVARTPTFGCSSAEEISRLQHLHTSGGGFDQELYQQLFQGECVRIEKGKVVEADIEAGNSSLLRVDRRLVPPGYLAPRGDFRVLRPQTRPSAPESNPRTAPPPR